MIPAYNEARRLPTTLADVRAYLDQALFTWELLLVDDGSTDSTLTLMQGFAAECGRELMRTGTSAADRQAGRMEGHADRQRRGIVRVLAEPHRGKAATVRAGMLAAQGAAVLFTDADLSTPLPTVEAMLPLLAGFGGGADIVIGSREGYGARRHDEPLYRHVMGRGFNLLVRLLAVPGVQDTQCGFKLFTQTAAHDLFGRLRLYGDEAPIVRGPMVTGFDVELLFLARRRHYRLVEQPVRWHHVPGSKVNPLRDAYRMLLDVVRVRLNALRGMYS